MVVWLSASKTAPVRIYIYMRIWNSENLFRIMFCIYIWNWCWYVTCIYLDLVSIHRASSLVMPSEMFCFYCRAHNCRESQTLSVTVPAAGHSFRFRYQYEAAHYAQSSKWFDYSKLKENKQFCNSQRNSLGDNSHRVVISIMFNCQLDISIRSSFCAINCFTCRNVRHLKMCLNAKW